MKKESADDLKGQLEAYAAVARMPERDTRGRWAKWPIYAAATGAALASASAASADIIYSGPLTLSTTVLLPFRHESGFTVFPDGKHGIRFEVEQVGPSRHFVSSTRFFPSNTYNPTQHNSSGNLFNIRGAVRGTASPGLGVGIFGSGFFEKNFALGAKIAPRGTNPFTSFGRQGSGNLGTLRSVFTHQGVFLGANGSDNPFLTPGFLGFVMFQTTSKGGVKPGSVEPGWIEVQFNPAYPGSIDVMGYAYNTDGPIDAGQTSDMPEPGTFPLMLLATGAVGVLAWKRRRGDPTAQDQTQVA